MSLADRILAAGASLNLVKLSGAELSELALHLSSNTCALAQLTLEKIALRDEVLISALLSALEQNHSLRLFALPNAIISPASACQLVAAVGAVRRISSLELVSCNLDDQAAVALASLLHDPVTMSAICKRYGHDYYEPLTCVVQQACVLTSLNLAKNAFTAEGVSVMAAALRTNPSLTNLTLTGVASEDEGCLELARALDVNVTLRHLCLSNNAIGDDGASALGRTLKSNNTLKTLRLNGNGIKDQGVLDLAVGIACNESLEEFSLLFAEADEESGVCAMSTALLVNVSISKYHGPGAMARGRSDIDTAEMRSQARRRWLELGRPEALTRFQVDSSRSRTSISSCILA